MKELIAEKLSGQHENFLRYCQEAGKKFVAELDREDFIAYRSEYCVPREQVEQIKRLIDFRERTPVEEPPSPQNIFDEPEDSLQKYFRVDDLAQYESILIADLDFNTRVQRCLSFNGYRTLAELLKSSKQELSGLKNFGGGSFSNLMSTLKKFFPPRKKVTPALRLANEELDEFLRDAALNHDPQIGLIIAAFEKFSASVTVKNLFRNVPEELMNKRAKFFRHVCSSSDADFFATLPEELTVAELPEYLAENSLELNADKLKNFVNALHFDARACAEKIVSTNFKDKRELDVVSRRAEGRRLEKIGKEFGVTRERIRQIELKSINRFIKQCADAKKIFNFLHALTDGKQVLTLDDAKFFIDPNVAEILWFFAAKIDLRNNNFHFDKAFNAFIFADGDAVDENELIKNLPDVMEEEIFAATIANLAREKNCSIELITLKLSKFYRRHGKIFHRGRLTLAFKCGYVLKARFPNGYKIGDEIFFSRFMRYLREIFGENKSLTRRGIDALIGKIGFLCDRGKYIHPDLVHVPPEVIERVKNFIDTSERTAIFYKELFESLKKFFVDTQITNHYFLQGAIKFHNLPYTLRKDYLTKSSEIDMAKEFDSFIAERGEVSARDIKENFRAFTDANINFLLMRCPEVIRIGDGNFVHASHLNLQDDDFEPIKKFLRQNCSTPISSRALLDLFFERFVDFMMRNDIQSHNKLFGVLQYMFRDEFNFSRPYISTADIKDISNKKFLLRLLQDVAEIEIDDLISICAENEIRCVSRTHLIDSLRPEFIRVDEFNLKRPESIGVTDEIISALVENVQSAIERNGGWQAAQTFDDYEWLPQLETPWNGFLLESILSLADDAPRMLKIPSTSVNFSSAIFVPEEFAEDDFQSFVLKILSAEHARESFRSEQEIFDWLKEQGLCNKKLPKFLEGGRALKLLRE